LLDTFLEWSSRSSLGITYHSYFEYLVNRSRFPDAYLLVSPSVTLESDYDPLEDDYFSDRYVGLNTPEYKDLVEYGLIPDTWIDPLAILYKPEIIEVSENADEEVYDNG